jgi:beta-lactamase superfamily II metal-dependent hydrolase
LPLAAQQLRIYHIDVEQASATLFVAPGGKTLLVDSGKNGMGQRIKTIMTRANVTSIDFFVDTHYHEDHYGGIDDLVNLGVPVGEAYDRGAKDQLAADKLNEKTFKDYQAAVGYRAHPMTRGMTLLLDSLMTVTCISSGGVVIGEDPPVINSSDENNLSISLLITFGSFRYFIGGDIQIPTEQKIADRDLVLNVDVYVADHHGSDTSSTIPFLQDLLPHVVIISNGDNVEYHHPRQSTLDAIGQLPGPPTVFQTNKCTKGPPCGNVPDDFIGDPQSSGQDGTIALTADLPTHRYTIAFDSGVTRTFQFQTFSPARPKLDFDGDGKSDILWQNTSGNSSLSLMNGLSRSGEGELPGPGIGWSVKQTGDFNGDGKSDILWQHTDGSTAMWLMNGTNLSSGAILLGPSTGWSVQNVGDFDGDGKTDILWQHNDGSAALWLMNGFSIGSGTILLGPGTGWSAKQVGDFNGDGKTDIVWQHTDGSTALWLMNGLGLSSWGILAGPGTGWSVSSVGDFNGDAKSDIVWHHSDGSSNVWLMNGLNLTSGGGLLGPGTGWSVHQVADFDGDGKSDILWQHTDGSSAIWLMNGVNLIGGSVLNGPATGWNVKQVGDYDGDGKSDILWQHDDGRVALWLMNGMNLISGGGILGSGTGWSPVP